MQLINIFYHNFLQEIYYQFSIYNSVYYLIVVFLLEINFVYYNNKKEDETYGKEREKYFIN